MENKDSKFFLPNKDSLMYAFRNNKKIFLVSEQNGQFDFDIDIASLNDVDLQ